MAIPSTGDLSTARILGLDSSSKAVGWALFEGERLIRRGKYIQQGDDHGEKLYHFYRFLCDLYAQHKPSQVVVELPFSAGRGKAFAVLIRYFGMIEAAHFAHFEQELPKENRLHPKVVKALLEVKPTNNHDRNKAMMVKEINSLYGLNLRFHPNNKSVSDDDIADAIALVHAWLLKEKMRTDVRRPPTRQNRNRTRTRKAPSR